MGDLSVKSIIEDYKKAVKELSQDPDPGKKAIVVYGGYMGKTFQTHSALNEIDHDEYYLDVSFPYNKVRKDWIHNIIKSSRLNNPVIILDSYWFSYQTCKKEIPEFNELIDSIPSGKFGFTLSETFSFYNNDSKEKKETLPPCSFIEIKSNLIFLIGYSTPDDLISIMPSFNFNFEGKQLLSYIRENIETIFPECDNLSINDRLEMVDLLNEALEIGVYKELDFKWIQDAFWERKIFEQRKKEDQTKEDFLKDFARHLKSIKNGRIS